MRCWPILIGIAMVRAEGYGQLPPPEKLRSSSAYDGASIRFKPVEGAVAYLGVLENEESLFVESPDPRLYFGNLDAMTEYNVSVAAVDKNGMKGKQGFLVFKTGVGEIQGLKILQILPTSITLAWLPIRGIKTYVIDATEENSRLPVQNSYMNVSNADPRVRMIGESSAIITDLKPMTYYKIAIRGETESGLGPVFEVRVRTDGNGYSLYNTWSNHNDDTIGGNGVIFKRLQTPNEPYAVTIDFPCEVDKFEVWNAVVDGNISYPESKFLILQNEVWMQEKFEIGFNFYAVANESRSNICDFDATKIIVLFGTAAFSPMVTEEYDIPYGFYHWNYQAKLTLKLGEVFQEIGQSPDEFDLRLPKPDRAHMVIQIILGENCSAIEIEDCWNVDRVYNASIDNGENKTYYFIQTRNMWFTNDIGLVVKYDDKTCLGTENFNATLLWGGEVVTSLQETYEKQKVSQTCADDPFKDPGVIVKD